MLETKADFDKCISVNKKVVIDFTACWFPPCKIINPRFEAMSEDFKDWTFVKVDADDNEETVEACGIHSMPSFKFYVDGIEVDQVTGADENALKEKLGIY